MMECVRVCVLVCVLLLSVSGFWGQQRVAPPPAVMVQQVRVGQDTILQCPLLDTLRNSSGASPSPTTLSWYKKAPGRGPQLLLSFRSNDSSNLKFGSTVGPEKVSVSANGSLLLFGSQKSDSALYYCGISQGGQGDKENWGMMLSPVS